LRKSAPAIFRESKGKTSMQRQRWVFIGGCLAVLLLAASVGGCGEEPPSPVQQREINKVIAKRHAASEKELESINKSSQGQGANRRKAARKALEGDRE